MLSPNDFGVFGIALLVLSILSSFTQTGYSQALIQKKEKTRQYLNTAWTIGLVRGFLIATMIFILAKPAAAIFALAPEFTRLFLGDKWMPIIPVI
ncbi:MAG: oligosaccharide flippase family protein [Actinomycetota bacterium]